MIDRSLYITGTYRAPGSTSDVPFTVDSSLAWGALLALLDLPPTATNHLTVVIGRPLATLFDDLDFSQDPAWALLDRLHRDAVVDFQPPAQ